MGDAWHCQPLLWVGSLLTSVLTPTHVQMFADGPVAQNTTEIFAVLLYLGLAVVTGFQLHQQNERIGLKAS